MSRLRPGRNRVASLLSLAGAATALAILVVAAVPVAAQDDGTTYDVPRTPWGDPDLQGVWPATDVIGVPMQRPEQYGTREFLTDEEYQQRVEQDRQRVAARVDEPDPNDDSPVTINPPGYWLDFGKPTRKTSLIVSPANGRMPEYTQAAIERRAARQAAGRGRGGPCCDEPANQSYYDRCISRGVMGSILPVIYNNGNQIVQTENYVVILEEMIHEARVIPLDGRPHVGAAVKSWMGDARGHWEGDTLVVETTNFVGGTNGIGLNGGGEPHSSDMVLVERFTRVADNQIQYEATINDPETWKEPWTVRFPLNADPDYKLFEYACHEGNYAMMNLLQGARADEAAEGGNR